MSCIISYPDLTLFYTEKSRGRSGYEIMSCIIQGGWGGGGWGVGGLLNEGVQTYRASYLNGV